MFTYENQGTNTFLVYQFQETDEIDMLSIGMLSNNHISGIAPLLYTQMNTDRYVKFNVSAMVTMDKFFDGKVNQRKLVDVFTNIAAALMEAEEYMLACNSFLWDMKKIFVNVGTNEVALICLPVLNREETVDIKMFFKRIMFETQFDDSEDCSYVAKIVNFLNSSEPFTFEAFKKELEGIGNPERAKKQEKPQIKTVEPVKSEKPTQVEMAEPVEVQATIQNIVQPAYNGMQMMKQPLKQAMAQPGTQAKKEVAATTKEAGSGLFKKFEKKPGKSVEEKKSSGLFGKKKSKEEATSAVASTMGFKVPGMSSGEEAIPGQSTLPAAVTAPQAPKPVVTPVVAPAQQIATTPVQPQAVTKPANFGNTTVLMAPQSNATTVLDAAAMPGMGAVRKPYLIRKKNNETIPIDKNDFRLGKERSFVDYFIGDNTAISRSHACIVCKNQEYYVVDTNSTNHTFVNDKMLQSNVETKLESGAKIRLADEEFEFKMM